MQKSTESEYRQKFREMKGEIDLNECRIVGHCSPNPYNGVANDGKVFVINQMRCSESMVPLSIVSNLPIQVQEFIERLKPNTVGLFDVDGSVYIEVTRSILQNMNCFQAFLTAFHSWLSDKPQLSRFVEYYEATEEANVTPPKGCNIPDYPKKLWVTINCYLVIHVKDMILGRLSALMAAKDESFNAVASVDYLAKHGFNDKAIAQALGITERSVYRYKAKSDMLSQSTKIESASIPTPTI